MSESPTQTVKPGGEATRTVGRTDRDPAREAAWLARRPRDRNVRTTRAPAPRGRKVRTTRAPAGERHRAGNVPMRRSDESPTQQIKANVRKLLATLLERGFGIALEAAERLNHGLDEIAARSGVKVNALLGGARAAVAGRSPAWGAIKGAFSALSPGAKAAVIIVLVLALLLLPVTVVLLLLALIAVAVVAVVKTRSARS
jgi:hypothetical protein